MFERFAAAHQSAAFVLCLCFLPLNASTVSAADEINIYSYREPGLLAPLLEAFTAETGIKTNIVFSDGGLIERTAAEGANSPVDVILTTGVGRLADAKAQGVTQAIKSETINQSIPANYRDPDGHWVGLSQRARIIYASKERVNQSNITYADLADTKWRGRICSRSGQHPYNVALLASIIANEGSDKALKWAEALKNNLARKPSGNDRSQVKGIYAGECDIAIGNSYYMAAMQNNKKKPEQQEWAKSVRILFPNSANRGTHVNISGAVLAKHAPHKAAALKFLEFLTSDQGQEIYAKIVNEYPLKSGVKVSDQVESWGTLKPDSLPLKDIAKYRKDASKIMDKVHFDQGPAS